MCRTNGAKNYFDTKELYQLKDCVGYCKREGVTVPDSWKKNKLHRLAGNGALNPIMTTESKVSVIIRSSVVAR